MRQGGKEARREGERQGRREREGMKKDVDRDKHIHIHTS